MTLQNIWLWVSFNVFILLLLAIDLGVLHRKNKAIPLKTAMMQSGVWIGIAFLFNIGIYFWFGPNAALEFLSGYLTEKALSIDNIFVFVSIFSFFKVPPRYQHKVLFFGILGAILMRASFIFLGIELIKGVRGVFYVFGVFLVFTGLRMAFRKNAIPDPGNNLFVKFLRKTLPVLDQYDNDHFFVRKKGKWHATLLFIVLIFVEATDIVFAVDSIPAILSITRDPFIAYTSNILAILGLRSLYFVLSGLVEKFHYLHYGLSSILTLLGVKMLVHDVYEIPTAYVLATVLSILTISVGASFIPSRQKASRSKKSKPEK